MNIFFSLITVSERPKPKYGRYRKLPTFRFPQIATDTETEIHAVPILTPIPIPKPKDENFEHIYAQLSLRL
jgi:hypothetical protein